MKPILQLNYTPTAEEIIKLNKYYILEVKGV